MGVGLTPDVRPSRVDIVHYAEATRVNTPHDHTAHDERVAVGVHCGRVPEG